MSNGATKKGRERQRERNIIQQDKMGEKSRGRWKAEVGGRLCLRCYDIAIEEGLCLLAANIAAAAAALTQ